VFGCGHNLKGELGAGFLRHLVDIVKIEGLSNYKIKVHSNNNLDTEWRRACTHQIDPMWEESLHGPD